MSRSFSDWAGHKLYELGDLFHYYYLKNSHYTMANVCWSNKNFISHRYYFPIFFGTILLYYFHPSFCYYVYLMSFLSYVQTKNVNSRPWDGQFTVVKRTTFKIKKKIPQVGGHNSLLKSFLLGLLLDTRHATSDLGWTVAPGSEVRTGLFWRQENKYVFYNIFFLELSI